MLFSKLLSSLAVVTLFICFNGIKEEASLLKVERKVSGFSLLLNWERAQKDSIEEKL